MSSWMSRGLPVVATAHGPPPLPYRARTHGVPTVHTAKGTPNKRIGSEKSTRARNGAALRSPVGTEWPRGRWRGMATSMAHDVGPRASRLTRALVSLTSCQSLS
jgi:hypothetical protein